MGMGKNVSKTNLAYTNQNRNCKIFEEFAYYMISETREKRKTKILISEGMYMRSTPLQLTYVLQSSGGPSSARRKEV